MMTSKTRDLKESFHFQSKISVINDSCIMRDINCPEKR